MQNEKMHNKKRSEFWDWNDENPDNCKCQMRSIPYGGEFQLRLFDEEGGDECRCTRDQRRRWEVEEDSRISLDLKSYLSSCRRRRWCCFGGVRGGWRWRYCAPPWCRIKKRSSESGGWTWSSGELGDGWWAKVRREKLPTGDDRCRNRGKMY